MLKFSDVNIESSASVIVKVASRTSAVVSSAIEMTLGRLETTGN